MLLTLAGTYTEKRRDTLVICLVILICRKELKQTSKSNFCNSSTTFCLPLCRQILYIFHCHTVATVHHCLANGLAQFNLRSVSEKQHTIFVVPPKKCAAVSRYSRAPFCRLHLWTCIFAKTYWCWSWLQDHWVNKSVLFMKHTVSAQLVRIYGPHSLYCCQLDFFSVTSFQSRGCPGLQSTYKWG